MATRTSRRRAVHRALPEVHALRRVSDVDPYAPGVRGCTALEAGRARVAAFCDTLEEADPLDALDVLERKIVRSALYGADGPPPLARATAEMIPRGTGKWSRAIRMHGRASPSVQLDEHGSGGGGGGDDDDDNKAEHGLEASRADAINGGGDNGCVGGDGGARESNGDLSVGLDGWNRGDALGREAAESPSAPVLAGGRTGGHTARGLGRRARQWRASDVGAGAGSSAHAMPQLVTLAQPAAFLSGSGGGGGGGDGSGNGGGDGVGGVGLAGTARAAVAGDAGAADTQGVLMERFLAGATRGGVIGLRQTNAEHDAVVAATLMRRAHSTTADRHGGAAGDGTWSPGLAVAVANSPEPAHSPLPPMDRGRLLPLAQPFTLNDARAHPPLHVSSDSLLAPGVAAAGTDNDPDGQAYAASELARFDRLTKQVVQDFQSFLRKVGEDDLEPADVTLFAHAASVRDMSNRQAQVQRVGAKDVPREIAERIRGRRREALERNAQGERGDGDSDGNARGTRRGRRMFLTHLSRLPPPPTATTFAPPPAPRPRIQYGAWYVEPSRWRAHVVGGNLESGHERAARLADDADTSGLGPDRAEIAAKAQDVARLPSTARFLDWITELERKAPEKVTVPPHLRALAGVTRQAERDRLDAERRTAKEAQRTRKPGRR